MMGNMVSRKNKTVGFLFSEQAVTVYSAILATPIVLGFAGRFKITAIPAWAFLLILAFVTFMIGGMLRGSGYIHAVINGIALGLAINALLASSIGSQLTARLSSITGRVSG